MFTSSNGPCVAGETSNYELCNRPPSERKATLSWLLTQVDAISSLAQKLVCLRCHEPGMKFHCLLSAEEISRCRKFLEMTPLTGVCPSFDEVSTPATVPTYTAATIAFAQMFVS